MSPRFWVLLGAALWSVCAAGQPPAQAPQPPAKPPADARDTPPADVPDDEFIEFLGEDDHGEAWWEYLKKTPPGKDQQATPPAQGPKQS
jgi:hypothetical protein